MHLSWVSKSSDQSNCQKAVLLVRSGSIGRLQGCCLPLMEENLCGQKSKFKLGGNEKCFLNTPPTKVGPEIILVHCLMRIVISQTNTDKSETFNAFFCLCLQSQ